MKTCPGYWPDAGTPCRRILAAGTCPKADDPDHGYYADRSLDPRWDWAEITTLSDPEPVWIKAKCKHLTPLPVETTDPVTGDVLLVARLCPDCDTQLETDWTRDQLPAPNGFERWVYGTSPEYRAAYTTEPDNRIPEGYRVNTLEKDPYKNLVFVGGGVVNKNARPPWYVRAGRAYWAAFVEVWEAQKRAVVVFLDTLGYMWPVYLVGLNYLLKWING